eukprot:192545-Chlamydomonas_euryale.AAC.1
MQGIGARHVKGARHGKRARHGKGVRHGKGAWGGKGAQNEKGGQHGKGGRHGKGAKPRKTSVAAAAVGLLTHPPFTPLVANNLCPSLASQAVAARPYPRSRLRAASGRSAQTAPLRGGRRLPASSWRTWQNKAWAPSVESGCGFKLHRSFAAANEAWGWPAADIPVQHATLSSRV